MSTRFLLTLLPALLAPLGVLGEAAASELRAGPTLSVEWDAGTLPGASGLRATEASSGGDADGEPDAAPSLRVVSTPGAAAPSRGGSRPLHALLGHLRRCGHDAGRLDLPPPPRD